MCLNDHVQPGPGQAPVAGHCPPMPPSQNKIGHVMLMFSACCLVPVVCRVILEPSLCKLWQQA